MYSSLSLVNSVIPNWWLSTIFQRHQWVRGAPGGSDGKESACNEGDVRSIPGLGRFPGEGKGKLLQYSCLGNPMDRGAWWATVHGVTKELDTTEWFSLTQWAKQLSSLKDLVAKCKSLILWQEPGGDSTIPAALQNQVTSTGNVPEALPITIWEQMPPPTTHRHPNVPTEFWWYFCFF